MQLRDSIKRYLREQCFMNPNSPPTYGNYGCMDPAALNFDSAATHPCSAGYPSFACQNCNSQPDYCGPGTGVGQCCIYPQPILGCTDPNACNYDVTATTDDGSCEYTSCLGCTDPTANNYDPTATIDDGNCTYDEFHLFTTCTGIVGGGSQGMTWSGLPGYDPNQPANNSQLFYTFLGSPNIGEVVKFDLANPPQPLTICLQYDGTTNQTIPVTPWGSPMTVVSSHGDCNDCQAVYGCTDPTAINYDPNATVDDNSCQFPVPGCTDQLAINYDPLATVDDGSCIYDLEPCCEWCDTGPPQGSTPPIGCVDWMCNNVDYCPPEIISDNPCDKLEDYVVQTYPQWGPPGVYVAHFCEKCQFGGLNDSMCKCCKKDPCDKIDFIQKVNDDYNLLVPEFCKYCINNTIQDSLCKCCKRFEKMIDKKKLDEEIKSIKKIM